MRYRDVGVLLLSLSLLRTGLTGGIDLVCLTG